MYKICTFNFMEHLGTIIRKKRKEVGVSVKELASQCGVAPFTIYRWEQGAYVPKAKYLPIIGKTLGIIISQELVVVPRIQ